MLEKNPGYKSLRIISNIINGGSGSFEEITEDLTLEEVAKLKFTPVTSCDVERSFSRYKSLLTDNRKVFHFKI